MQELIKVQVEGDQQLVSARDLHKGLEIKKRFSAWVEQNFKDFEEYVDFTSVPTSTVVGNGAVKPLVDYALTIDMAKQLCLLSRTEKGKQYRKYLIEVEKKWNDPDAVIARGYKAALEKTKTLELENKQMKPKALFADAVSTSKSTIDVGQMAKILRGSGLNIGRDRFYAWLRDNGFVIKTKGRSWNSPTQKALDMNVLRLSEKISDNPDGSVTINTKTVVTGRGQIYFVNKLVNNEQLELV